MKRIFLIGEIGFELNIDYLRFQLDGVQENEEIQAVVCSPGGKVLEAIAMKGLLSMHKGKKTATVVGIAGSSATGLLHAFDVVEADADAWYMIHNIKGVLSGTPKEMEQQLNSVKGFNTQIRDNLVQKSGKSENEIQKMMDAETYMRAQQAVDSGFIDSVVNVDKSVYNTALDDAENKILGIVNKAVPKQGKPKENKNMIYDKLLNLGADATEQDRKQAVQSLVNQVKDLQAKVDEKTAAVKSKDTEMQSLQNKVESLSKSVQESTATAQETQLKAELMELLNNKGRTLSDDAKASAMRRLRLINSTKDTELAKELRNDLSMYIDNTGVEVSERLGGAIPRKKDSGEQDYEQKLMAKMEELQKAEPNAEFGVLMNKAKTLVDDNE